MQAKAVIHPISASGVVAISASSEVAERLKPDVEVEILALDGDLYLRHKDSLEACEAEGRLSWRLRDACTDASIERLCVVQDVRAAGDKAIVTLAVRELGPLIEVEQIRFLVDERIVESVEKLERRALGASSVCRMLLERCVLPPIRGGRRARLLMGRGRDEAEPSDLSRPFSIIGDGLRLDVRLRRNPSNEQELVYAVTRVSKVAGGRSPAARAVVEAEIAFVDQSQDAGVAAAIEAQLGALNQREDTFLGLWKRYQEIEIKLRLEKAKEHPTVPYTSCEARGDGLYLLRIPTDKAKVHGLRPKDEVGVLDGDRSPEQLEQMMLGALARAKRLEDATAMFAKPSDAHANGPKEIAGTVDGIDQGGEAVYLRCEQEPPSTGFLGASIMGDVAMQKRRAQALQMISEGDCRMQQLALMLEEIGPVTTRRPKAEKPVTQRLLERVFTDASGKSWQPTKEQREAIDIALNTPDIAVIQGPPGTGKTTVMRAIIERIHELNSKDPGRRDRFLVTGFQHDAVENATEKLEVDGVPSMKAGGRREKRKSQLADEDLRIDAFVDQVLNRSSVLQRGPLKSHADLRAIEDEIVHCACEPKSAAATVAVIDGMLQRFGPRLSRNLHEGLAQLGERFRRDSEREPSPELARLERAIRAIRCTPASFADDGVRNAHIAIALLERADCKIPLTALHDAARWTNGGELGFLPQLEHLRHRLLLVYARRSGSEALTFHNDDLLELLQQVHAEVRSRVEQTSAADEMALGKFQESLEDREALRETLNHYSIVMAATCQQSVSSLAAKRLGSAAEAIQYENVLCDEAARANPLDLLVPMAYAKRRIILVGDHRQLPHIVEDEIEERLLSERSADGEGADSAEQLRSEFSRALETSLFERIYGVLRQREQKDGIRRVVTLKQQFRMHPVLGEFVSKQFYPPEEQFGSPKPASDFRHDFDAFDGMCAAWHDVPGEPESRDQNKSRFRRIEAREIVKLLKPMLEKAVETGLKTTFGVIAFYRAQVDEIKRELVRAGIMSEVEKDDLQLLPAYEGRVRVGTVDAFQGREFDVVFLSVVRSNTMSDSIKRYGHLMSPNRMCVAMSRQKQLLVVVGDRRILGPTARTDVPALLAFFELAVAQVKQPSGVGGAA